MPASQVEKNVPADAPMNKVITFVLKMTALATPLLFIPLTFEYFEFNKQSLLWAAAGVALFAWLFQAIVVERRVVYKRTPLDIPIVAVLVVWGLATALSVTSYSSLFGSYGRFSDAYAGIISLAVLYFVLVQTLSRRDAEGLLRWFETGALLALAVGLFSVLGVFSFATPGFNPVGATPETLAVFAACVVVLVAALRSYHVVGLPQIASQRWWHGTLACVAAAVLVVVNAVAAWVTLAIAGAALLFFGLYISYARFENPPVEIKLGPALSALLFAVIMLFVFGGAGSLSPQALPREALVPRSVAWDVAMRSMRERPLFGFGPGAYTHAFSAGRPASFNMHSLWQIRFDKAPSYWLELPSTVGIIGTLAYAGLIAMSIFILFLFVRNVVRASQEDSYVAFGFSFLAVGAIVAQAVYPAPTVLLFVFWFGLAAAMANWRFAFAKFFATYEIDLRGRRDVLPIAQALALALLGVYIAGSIHVARAYAADIAYKTFRDEGSVVALESAARINERRMQYHIALARTYMAQVADDVALLSTPGGIDQVSDERREMVRTMVDGAVRASEMATAVAPNTVAAWETAGALYRDIRFIAVGSTDPAVRYFKRAQELEPTNPVFATEIGKLHLDRNETGEAVSALERAVALKPDYVEAYRGLAKTYDALGQTDKALVTLEEVMRAKKTPELLYETGRLYYNQGKLEQAVAQFNEALTMRPGYANALYSLGLAYQKQGETQAALEQFRAVLELNPGNAAVRALIEELEE